MATKLTRRSVVTNTIKVGFSTFVSKSLGLLREIFLARFFGVGALADAFFTAFRIPNSLRKIFAEGALSAAIVPSVVTLIKRKDIDQASRLMVLLFCVVQGVLFLLCLLVCFNADTIISFIAPGWSADGMLEQYETAVTLLRILIFFIVFISSSSLLAGALQAVHKFAVPASSQIVMNVLFLADLLLFHYFSLSVYTLAVLILGNGLIVFCMHAWAYACSSFLFLLPNRQTFEQMWYVLKKFVPCAIGMGAVEINVFIDQALASYLPTGSISLLRYTYGFTRIPIGVFAVALSTVLLPYFSHITTYAPRRMSFYLLESAKLVLWVTLPSMLFMSAFSYKIFYTTLLSSKFTMVHVQQASVLLVVFLTGLFFFCFNKIVLNIFYAMHETALPTTITIIGAVINTLLNFIGIYLFGLQGIILATVLAAGVQLAIFLFVLHSRLKLKVYVNAFFAFAYRYTIQLSLAAWLFYGLYCLSYYCIIQLPERLSHMLLWTIGYWFWVAPLAGVSFLFLYTTRRFFGVKLYFLG